MNILYGVATYFILGLVVLIVFDAITTRIRTKIRGASYDTMDRLASSGTVVGRRTSLILLVTAIWVFWPVVIIGALKGD